MSKLLKFKEWLTVAEAARHLSIMLGEEATEADVLQLGLGGHLQLSVNFVNGAKANPMRVFPTDAQPMYVAMMTSAGGISFPTKVLDNVMPDDVPSLPAEIRQGLDRKELCFVDKGTPISEGEVVVAEKRLTTLHGIWDLPLIGSERLDVEYWYQQLVNGPEVTLVNVEGAFVNSPEGELYRLLESWEENEYQSGSRAHQRRIEGGHPFTMTTVERKDWLREYNENERKKFLEEQRATPEYERYYPAGKIPDDAVLVIRTSALQDLQNRMMEPEKIRSVSTKERGTFLNIIAVLAKTGFAWDGKKPHSLFKEVAEAAAAKGLSMPSENNFVRKLQEATEYLIEKAEK